MSERPEGDIVIALTAKDGRLLPSQMKIHVFNETTQQYEQLGLIQHFRLEAAADDSFVDLSTKFTDIPGMSDDCIRSRQHSFDMLSRFKGLKVS